MSRILVLLPVALWFVWVDARAGDGRVEPLGVVLFLGGLALAVLVLAYAAGRAARREARGRSARQRVFRVARALVLTITLVWFGYALFFLGWGEAVRHLVERPTLPPLVAPGMFLATLPVYLTWALLLAAEYPIIRQRRESRLLIDLNDGRPVHSPPPAWRYWVGALRQRLLFALVPLALLMVLRDTALFALWAMGASSSPGIEAGLFVASALLIIALSPELIRRLLPTRPLPAGPLRDRLERMGQRTGLPMRDVLVWDTDSTMVNAAVIGFLPGCVTSW